jgi:hypothetical protein
MSIATQGFIRPFVELARRTEEIHGPTLALAAGLFILLRIMRLVTPRVPGALVAVALAIGLSITLDLSGKGVALVGEIATGLPRVVLPDVRGMVSEEFALSAIGIFVVSFISGIVTARSFATRNRYRIDADRELIGFGAANVAAGLFGGFPVTGADSRTAINDALGGKTQVAGLVAAVSLAFSSLFLIRLLVHLPLAALAAVLAAMSAKTNSTRLMRQIRINAPRSNRSTAAERRPYLPRRSRQPRRRTRSCRRRAPPLRRRPQWHRRRPLPRRQWLRRLRMWSRSPQRRPRLRLPTAPRRRRVMGMGRRAPVARNALPGSPRAAIARPRIAALGFAAFRRTELIGGSCDPWFAVLPQREGSEKRASQSRSRSSG